MTTDTTTSETAPLRSNEPEDERPGIGSEDAPEPDIPEDRHAMEEAGARAWTQMQHDATPFFKQMLQPQWLLLVLPIAVIYVYAAIVMRLDEWVKPGAQLIFQPFVPLLALGLVWFLRQQVIRRFYELAFLFPEDSPKRRGNAAATAAIAILSCLLMVGAAMMKSAAIVMLGLIIAIAAVVYGLFGPFLFRTLWQPLAFLVLTIPPPAAIIDRTTFFLQKGTTFLAVLLAQQFDKGAQPLYNSNMEPMVHLTSGDLVISPALCGAGVAGSTFALTIWWCLAKRVPALQSILLVALGIATAVILNTLRLLVLCLLTSMGAFGISGVNPWLLDLTSLVLVALAFGVVVLVTRRVLEMMVRRADVPVIEDDDMEADLEDILRGDRETTTSGGDSAARNGDVNR